VSRAQWWLNKSSRAGPPHPRRRDGLRLDNVVESERVNELQISTNVDCASCNDLGATYLQGAHTAPVRNRYSSGQNFQHFVCNQGELSMNLKCMRVTFASSISNTLLTSQQDSAYEILKINTNFVM